MESVFPIRTVSYGILACTLTITVWILAYWTVLEERESRSVASAEQAKRLAVFFERNTLGIFRYSDAYIKMVRRAYVEHGDLNAIRALIREVPLDQSIVSHITIIDALGTPILVSGHSIKASVTAKDRDYFKLQKATRGDLAYVSLPHRGRNSGKIIVRLVRRITTPDGRFGGVIFAAIETQHITDFITAMDLGPQSSATLVGLDRKIRARSSYGRLGPGQDISGSILWQNLKQQPVGLYKQTSVVDHITRYYAYRQLTEYPLIVAIGVATDDIAQAALQFQYPVYTIAFLITILIATMVTLFIRERVSRQRLAASESHIRTIVETVQDGIITVDDHGCIETCNNGAQKMFGYSAQEVTKQPITALFDTTDQRDASATQPNSAIDVEALSRCGLHEVWAHRQDGTRFPAELSVGKMRSDKRHLCVVTVRDITESHLLTQQMAHQATHDELTGLVNRREFGRRLSQALKGAQRLGKQHALCCLDLDRFKLVNDSAGHQAGDALLKQVSQALIRRIRQRDTLARLGGDEFSVLLENCELDKAREIAESLVAAVDDVNFTWNDQTFDISVSIGLVAITAAAESPSQLMSQADIACYTAKDLGRNRVCEYSPDNDQMNRHHNEVFQATALNDTLAENRLRLFLQPIFALNPWHELNEPSHYEIVVRMLDKQGQLILPNAFIPAAERYGLMGNIDRWVIKMALCHYWELIGSSKEAGININLSGNSLTDEGLLAFVRQQFLDHDVPPERVCFEITETAAVSNLTQASLFITAMKTMGCRFALDDFGSGLSSFTYLKHLPVDYVKIDGSFIKDMAHNDIDRAMTGAINELGHILGIRTIAEYVESRALVGQLIALGVDFAQGDALGRPVPGITESTFDQATMKEAHD